MKAIREMLLGIALMIFGFFAGLLWLTSGSVFWIIAAVVVEIIGLVNVIDGFFVGRRDD